MRRCTWWRVAPARSDLTAATRATIQPIQSIVDLSVSPRRFIVQLLVAFAGFALILASLGIYYAVISSTVSQRKREIGIAGERAARCGS